MARIGINPARGQVVAERPKRLTITMVTYIPELTGYFEQRLEVLKLSLASLIAHTAPPHDLMIFDNGSCTEVVQYLRQMQAQGAVNFLLLSQKNIGKIDALRILFQAAPGEIIAYSDDDILFYPGWLEAHLEILEYFPRAGMVSGAPLRNAAGHARKSLDALASSGAVGLSVERTRRIPDEWEADWALSTGRDPQAHLAATRDHLDLVFRQQKDGGYCEAIGSANHFQFVTTKQIILKALPSEWTGKLMGSMIELDEAVDNLGYLRLSTVQRYTRHLGNVISPQMAQEARALSLLASGSEAIVPLHRSTKRHWLLRIPGGRRALTAIYRRIFAILYR